MISRIKSSMIPPTYMKISFHIDKIGSLGALLLAMLAPCCFPLLGVIGTALGLSALEQFAPQLQIAIQILVVIAFIGSFITYRYHQVILPLGIAACGVGLVFYHYYAFFSEPVVYTGFGFLVASGAWNTILNSKKKRSTPILNSTITCPECGFQQTEKMPTDACLYFWDCPQCSVRLKPKKGDCCIFCSFGSVPCPPIQLSVGCCG